MCEIVVLKGAAKFLCWVHGGDVARTVHEAVDPDGAKIWLCHACHETLLPEVSSAEV